MADPRCSRPARRRAWLPAFLRLAGALVVTAVFVPTPAHAQRQAQQSWWDRAPVVRSRHYLIKADLPELTKKDITVRVDNGNLYITGERRAEKNDWVRYHRTERFYGSFVRSFLLPNDADPEKVSASFRDGVLSVHIQKSEHAKPRQIEVKVG